MSWDVTSSLETGRFGCGLPGVCSGGSFAKELPAQQWLACPGTSPLGPGPVLPLLDHFLPKSSCQGPAPLPARPPVPGAATALDPAPGAPRELPAQGFLQQNCAQALLWKSPPLLCQSVLVAFFSPSAILLRFLTFKPVCQLLLSVLTGSCWLNP